MSDDERSDIYDDFTDSVNMQPKEIEEWLKTDESKSVGQDSGDGESKGRKSGKRIVEIKRTNKEDLTEDDYEHMRTVTSYIARHSAQRPDGEIEDTDWCYSLKNWGHDPTKD